MINSRKETVKTKSAPVMEFSLIERLLAIEPDRDIVNCDYCLYHTQAANEDKRHCKSEYCLYVAERMPFGQVTYNDAVTAAVCEAADGRFKNRAVQLMNNPKAKPLRFMDIFHRKQFGYSMQIIKPTDRKMVSQIYLLTADVRLWDQIHFNVSRYRVDFEHFKPRGFTGKAYTLLCAARDLLNNTDPADLSDLADTGVVETPLFNIICNALAIHRFGEDILALPIDQNNKEGSDAN